MPFPLPGELAMTIDSDMNWSELLAMLSFGARSERFLDAWELWIGSVELNSMADLHVVNGSE